MAGEIHGSKAQLKIQNAGGALTVVDGGSESGVEESIDTAEISQFGDIAKAYIAGLSDGSGSFNGSATPTNKSLIAGIKQLTRTFEYYPAGNTTGQEKLAGSLIITQFNRTSNIDGKAELSVNFQITGVITVTLVP